MVLITTSNKTEVGEEGGRPSFYPLATTLHGVGGACSHIKALGYPIKENSVLNLVGSTCLRYARENTVTTLDSPTQTLIIYLA